MGRSEFADPLITIRWDSDRFQVSCLPPCECGTVSTAEMRENSSIKAVVDGLDSIRRALDSLGSPPVPVNPASQVLPSTPIPATEITPSAPHPLSPTLRLPFTYSPVNSPGSSPTKSSAPPLRPRNDAVTYATGVILLHPDFLLSTLSDDPEAPARHRPDLELVFTTRELVDVYSHTGALETTESLYEFREVLPWRDFPPALEAALLAKGAGRKPAGKDCSVSYPFRIPLPSWLPATATLTWGCVDHRLSARFLVDDDHPLAEECVARRRCVVDRGHGRDGVATEMGVSDVQFGGDDDATAKEVFRCVLEVQREVAVEDGVVEGCLRLETARGTNVAYIKGVEVGLVERRQYE
ncbi:hypothetical protein HK101_004501 [Irineochytrium annulatum]|nr:hypothetical protein HK101_004501 [Irineochytrium annulatum]